MCVSEREREGGEREGGERERGGGEKEREWGERERERERENCVASVYKKIQSTAEGTNR